MKHCHAQLPEKYGCNFKSVNKNMGEKDAWKILVYLFLMTLIFSF